MTQEKLPILVFPYDQRHEEEPLEPSYRTETHQNVRAEVSGGVWTCLEPHGTLRIQILNVEESQALEDLPIKMLAHGDRPCMTLPFLLHWAPRHQDLFSGYSMNW